MHCLPRGLILVTLSTLTTTCLAAGEGPWELVCRHHQEPIRVKMALEARGTLLSDEGDESVPMSVTAQSIYLEKFYGTAAAGTVALRKYERARSRIQVGDSSEETTLPASKSEVVVSVSDDPQRAVTLSSVDQHLSRQELDAIELPGDGLVWERFLPEGPVVEGAAWAPTAEAVAVLLQLDDVTDPGVRCRLSEVRQGLAIIVLAGTVVGRAHGAATRIELSGEVRLDVQRQLIRWCQLKWKEDRNASSTGPAVQAVAEFRMLREPTALSAETQWPGAIDAPGQDELLLEYTSQQAGFRFLHERHWVLVEDHDRKTTMRLVRDGQVQAQCHWSRLDDQPPGKQLSLEGFQDDIRQALKEQFVEFESATQFRRDDGVAVMRVAALGTVEKGPVRWLYCHLQDRAGKRVSFVGVMGPNSAEQETEIDRVLLGSLQILPKPDPSSPAQPVQQAERDRPLR